MPVAVHQVGNIGTVLRFTVRDQDGGIINISTATIVEAFLRAGPKGSPKTFGPVLPFTTDGSDGKFDFITSLASDLDVADDNWVRQGHVIVPGLGDFKTNVITFPVKPNIV